MKTLLSNSRITKNETVGKRTDRLVQTAYRRNLLPTLASSIGVQLMLVLNSLFAGRFIGESAVAAAAMLIPFTLFQNVLHDYFVAGTISTVTRRKSVGNNAQACRAFGAILINQLFWYVLIDSLFFIFGKQLMHLFSGDEQLVANALDYFYPYIVAQPLIGMGMCLERGLRVDGRPGFFAFRRVLVIILNLSFNALVIFVFHGGIRGLSIASSLAAVLAYAWPASHLFSRDCRIRPDLSVISSPGEMKEYIKEETDIGLVFALDDGLFAVVGSVLNRMLLLAGGTAAITVYGIVSVFSGLYNALCTNVQSTNYLLVELFYSGRDYKSAKIVNRSTLKLEVTAGAILCLCALIFPDVIAASYALSTPDTLSLLPFMLFFEGIYIVFMCLSNVLFSDLIAVRRNREAKIMNVANNLSLILGTIAGGLLFEAKGLFAVRAAVVMLVFLFELNHIRREKAFSGSPGEVELGAFSYELTADSAAEVGRRVCDFFSERGCGANTAMLASLVTEEYNYLLLEKNKDSGRPVSVDLRLLADKEGYTITMMDNGVIFDPREKILNKESEQTEISRRLLQEISPGAKYSRVLDLNVSRLDLSLKEKTERTPDGLSRQAANGESE